MCFQGGMAMTQYQGSVQSYVPRNSIPKQPYDQKAVISLHGAFGLAILYFVPQDEQLGQNQKRAGQDIFDIYYWMDSWPHFTDLLKKNLEQDAEDFYERAVRQEQTHRHDPRISV